MYITKFVFYVLQPVMIQLLMTLGSLLLWIQETWGFDYCEITCNGTKHTMCVYPKGGGEDCMRKEQVYLTLEEKRWILEIHNNFRQQLASGKESRGLGGHRQPPAGNMMKMVWDSEVAMIAKLWANQCNEPANDKCRKAMDGKKLGQNSVVGEYKFLDLDTGAERFERIKQIVVSWQDEVVNFDPELVRKYNPDKAGNTTHYTQTIWANTIFLGCGYTEFRMGNDIVQFRFVCNYKPMGNLPFETVYRPGSACSSCPPRSNCSETWDALCWDGTSNIFVNADLSCSICIISNTFLVLLPFLACCYL